MENDLKKGAGESPYIYIYIYIYIYMDIYKHIYIYIYILVLLPDLIPRNENRNPKKTVNIRIDPGTEIYFSQKNNHISLIVSI